LIGEDDKLYKGFQIYYCIIAKMTINKLVAGIGAVAAIAYISCGGSGPEYWKGAVPSNSTHQNVQIVQVLKEKTLVTIVSLEGPPSAVYVADCDEKGCFKKDNEYMGAFTKASGSISDISCLKAYDLADGSSAIPEINATKVLNMIYKSDSIPSSCTKLNDDQNKTVRDLYDGVIYDDKVLKTPLEQVLDMAHYQPQ
jgi:hypothetical protein